MTDSAYQVILTKAAYKDLAKLRQWSSVIEEQLRRLELEPLQGEALRGSLDGVRVLHFRIRGSGEARIAYLVHPDNAVCLVIAIRPRENFYDILERRIASFDE